MTTRTPRFVFSALVALVAACVHIHPLHAQSVKRVTVAIAQPVVALGNRTTASASVRLANGQYSTTRIITWGSSNPDIVVVSDKGVVSTVRAGSAMIAAIVGSVRGEAIITVTPGVPLPPTPLTTASVSVSFGATSLVVGQTTIATAVARDSTGDILLGRQAIWTSVTPSLASVSPATGLVTALAAGTATIRATVESKVASAAITVVAPPADTVIPHDTVTPPSTPGHPNEPVGFTQLSPTLSGDTIPLAVYGPTGWVEREGSVTQVTDSAVPFASKKVLNIYYPSGMIGGGSPGMIWTASSTNPQNWGAATPPTQPKQLYQSWWYKISDNFPINLVANKTMYSNIGGQNQVAIEINGSADYPMGPGNIGAVFAPNQATQYNAAIFPAICLQGTVGIDGVSNNGRCLNVNSNVASGNPAQMPDSVQIKRGRWYHFETLYIANTAGHWDGGAKLWINGILRVDYTNRLKWIETAEYWQWTSWTPVYGGGGSIPNDGVGGYHRLKDFYVSGKP